jgi:hypothetical protein
MRIFVPKGDEKEGRRVHNKELPSLYPSANIVRMIKTRRLRWAGYVARIKESMSAFKVLTGKTTGKRPIGRPRRRWEYNIRMDPKEMGVNTKNWFYSA